MDGRAIRWDSWSLAEEADRRFRRILLRLGLPFLILALALPYLELAGLQSGAGELDAKRYVEFQAPPAPVAAQEEEPAPVPEEQPPLPPQPETREAPAREPPPPQPDPQQRVEQARAKAQQALAWTSQISGLTQSEVAPRLAEPLLQAEAGQAEHDGASEALAAAAAASSGGIGEVAAAERRASGTALGARRTTTVESPVGVGRQGEHAGQGGDKRVAGRTLEEIQLVFDRNKGAFYSLYMRALRQNANLRGKVVLRLTIAPNGSVTDCSLVSSELRDPELERKIVQRVMLLNFGAKDVPPMTIPSYPLVFFPI